MSLIRCYKCGSEYNAFSFCPTCAQIDAAERTAKATEQQLENSRRDAERAADRDDNERSLRKQQAWEDYFAQSKRDCQQAAAAEREEAIFEVEHPEAAKLLAKKRAEAERVLQLNLARERQVEEERIQAAKAEQDEIEQKNYLYAQKNRAHTLRLSGWAALIGVPYSLGKYFDIPYYTTPLYRIIFVLLLLIFVVDYIIGEINLRKFKKSMDF